MGKAATTARSHLNRLRRDLSFQCVSVIPVLFQRQSCQASNELRAIYTDTEPSPEVTEAVALIAEDTAAPAATAQPTIQPTLYNSVATEVLEPDSFSDYWPSSYPSNAELRISSTFQKLRQQNKEIVGWLTIDGVLDEPVLQRDNEYYLTHDVTGKENITGALFLDESCNLREVPHNIIIHGHNMKEGAMFGSLKKYKVKDETFYKEHPYITFNTLYEEAQYVIFAVSEVDIRFSNHYYLPFWQYSEFWSKDEFTRFINPLRSYSHFQSQVDVKPGDRLLTLATCSGDDENKRLLVAARMLREGEDTLTLSQGIYSTTVK
ncbi:MAG: class B sortase [Eubacteriales bacterium]|nr:class B sortase [Eubacteriales bacterium]